MAIAKYKKTEDFWNKIKNKKGFDKSEEVFTLIYIYII